MNKKKRVFSNTSLNFHFFHRIITYSKNNSWILYCAILIFSVLLRLPNLNESLWYDEVKTTMRLGDVKTLLHSISDGIYPFPRVMMFIWIKLFGDSEISVRMPSLISGILSIFLVYAIALKFADKKTALLTVFFMCVSPVHIWYSQEARHYSATLCFLLLAIFSYYKLSESQTKKIWYFVYSGFLFLAVFSHYYVTVYLALFSIMCLYKSSKVKWNILRLNAVILICLALFIAWKCSVGTFFRHLGYLRPFTLFELWMLFFNWFLAGNSLWSINPYRMGANILLQNPLMLCIQVFFFIVLMRGVILHFNKSRKPYNVDIILYLFSLPLFLMVLSLFIKKSYIERSAFFCLPFFYLILAQGIIRFETKTLRNIGIMSIVVFNLIVLIGFFSKNDQWTVYKQNPDWRSAACYFNDERKYAAGKVVVFITTPAYALTYYDKRFIKRSRNDPPPSQVPLRIHLGKSADHIYNTLAANKIKTFYLLKNRYWKGHFPHLLKKVRGNPRFHFLSSRFFKGIEIFKFDVVNTPENNVIAKRQRHYGLNND